MFASRIYLLISILAVASGAPKTRITRSTPTWHLPCGNHVKINNHVNSEEETSTQNTNIKSDIKMVEIQYQLTLKNYLLQDFEYLYEKVQIGVNEHQYIPSWIPGKKDVNAIIRLNKPTLNLQTVSTLHSSYVYIEN